MNALEILDAAKKDIEDRAKHYDKDGERSVRKVVPAFNALTGHNLTVTQGWLFMILLKAARSQQGEFYADDYEDGAAYFGLMGEEAEHGR